MNLEETLKKWKKIKLPKIEATILKTLEPKILVLNKAQLREGKDRDDILLPTYKSINYANFKSELGSKSGNHFDLKVTGDFYKGFFLKKKGDNFKVDSKDKKRDDLVMKTSPFIFGLNDKHTAEIESNFENQITDILQKAMQ